MDRLARLVEELEARPRDAERVAALRRWLAAGDRAMAQAAGPWLVIGAMPRRPVRVPLPALREAATAWLGARGVPRWEVDAGVEAADDVAEALAWLMEGHAGHDDDPGGRDAAAWLPAWTSAMARADEDGGGSRDDLATRRARRTIDLVARLPDAFARRWALRAAAGLSRALVTPWQWTRALAAAKGVDVAALAWRLHRAAAAGEATLWPGDLSPAPDGPVWPRPAPWRAQREASGEDAARLAGDWRAEPRWPGWRLQVVVAGGAHAVWHVEGELLDARLPPEVQGLVSRLVREMAGGEPGGKGPAAFEAVLLAWDRASGRALTREAAERAGAMASATSAGRRRVAGPPAAAAPSWHLALVGRDPGDPLRASLPAWPVLPEDTAAGASPAGAPAHDPPAARGALASTDPPPDLFVTASRPARPDDLAPTERAPLTRHGARGLLLHGPAAEGSWIVRPPPRRLLVVLQYLPADWWRGGASPDPRALAAGEAGVALWSRRVDEAAARSSAGTVDTGPDAAPALLPLARLPLAPLGPDVLAALHAAARERSAQRFGTLALLASPWAVLELAFDAVSPSRRHRVGAVLAGARLLGWRTDLSTRQAHALDDLHDPAD